MCCRSLLRVRFQNLSNYDRLIFCSCFFFKYFHGGKIAFLFSGGIFCLRNDMRALMFARPLRAGVCLLRRGGRVAEQGERSETKRKRALEVRLRLKFAPLILKGNCINIQKCVFYLYDSYEIRRLFSCQCRKN